ncbi:MAG: hypothetical protein AAFR52_09765 [Pseudomonadota bacterium]
MRNGLFIFAMVALAATPAAAYIGPGIGAGTIAVVLGVLASIVMAFVAILWYPVKRMLKKKKAAPATTGTGETEG